MKYRPLQVVSALGMLGYLVLVSYACFSKSPSLPMPEWTLWGIPQDKIMHFLMFLPFPFLMYAMFYYKVRRYRHIPLLALAILLFGFAVAGFTELIQEFIPYRSSDILDFAADNVALLSGTVIVALIHYWAMKR